METGDGLQVSGVVDNGGEADYTPGASRSTRAGKN